MALLNRGPGTPRTSGITTKIEFNVVNIIILVIFSFILIQAIGILFGDFLGFEVALGPVFILLAAGATAATTIAVFKKMFTNQPVTKQDIFAIVIVALLTILMMFFLRDFVPEIFEQSFVQLQSMVGM